MNNKLPLFVRLPVNWHSLVLNTFDVTVLYYFTCWKKAHMKFKWV